MMLTYSLASNPARQANCEPATRKFKIDSRFDDNGQPSRAQRPLDCYVGDVGTRALDMFPLTSSVAVRPRGMASESRSSSP
jgi:hypothetical protein